jgi:hypothetical protein
MTLAMDEVEVAFLATTGAPLWQPLGNDPPTAVARLPRKGRRYGADDHWTEIVLQFELDRAWNEVVALLEDAASPVERDDAETV